MSKIFIIDGGAGRVISAIPALLKYSKLNPNTDWKILIPGWEDLYYGIPELQDRTFSIEIKGVFDNVLSKASEIIHPEPYHSVRYINQKISIAEAFDEIINQTDNHSDLLPPQLKLSKSELSLAENEINKIKNVTGKSKLIVINPFGRGCQVSKVEENSNLALEIVDESHRSLSAKNYLEIVKELSKNYALVFFGEKNLYLKDDVYTVKFELPLRMWAALTQKADYFIGVDSVGQHIARAVNTEGIVLFGSTFPINTSYPNFFHILEKTFDKKYAPIRLSTKESMIVGLLNEDSINFDEEIEELINIIINDIEGKTQKKEPQIDNETKILEPEISESKNLTEKKVSERKNHKKFPKEKYTGFKF